MLDSIDHIIIAVRDLEAAAHTYSRMLGAPPWWRGDHPKIGTRNALFALANTSLELLAEQSKGALGGRLGRHLEHHGEGLFAIAFATADARRCGDLLRSRGLSATDPLDGEGRESDGERVRRWRCVYLSENETRGIPLFAIERAPEDPAASPAPGRDSLRLDHVVVTTGDADACVDLYRDRLGLRLALDRSFEELGLRLLFFRIGGATLEVATSLGAEPAPIDHLWGLAYRVDDIEHAARRLLSQGFDVSEVRDGRKPGTRVCTVRRETHGVATLFIGPAKVG